MKEFETGQELAVTLNGARDYVQGSQILTQTTRALSSMNLRLLHQGTFNKITDRLITAHILVPGASLPKGVIGTALFDDDAEAQVRVAWRETDRPAPRIDLPLRCRWSLLSEGSSNPLDAEFALFGIQDLGDFLDGIVQTIKARHGMLSQDVRDIWFTGIRRAGIPTGRFPTTEGRLSLRCNRIMGNAIGYQSLQHVSFTAAEGVVIEAVVTFSFKSKEFENIY